MSVKARTAVFRRGVNRCCEKKECEVLVPKGFGRDVKVEL